MMAKRHIVSFSIGLALMSFIPAMAQQSRTLFLMHEVAPIGLRKPCHTAQMQMVHRASALSSLYANVRLNGCFV